MVRIKERYLLVSILYPPDNQRPQKANVPGLVAIHRPTTDRLTAHALLSALRATVTEIFGDYGAGAVSGNLRGKGNARKLRH